MRTLFAVILCLRLGLLPALMEDQLASASRVEVSEALAGSIWRGRGIETDWFFEGLKTGMREANGQSFSYEELREFVGGYEMVQLAEFDRHATQNHAASGEFFDALMAKSDLSWVVEKGVAFLVQREGNGRAMLLTPSKARFHCRVEPCVGTADRTAAYLDTRMSGEPIDGNPNRLLPSLWRAMVGMQRGEVRAVYLHPDYAYGSREAFEPGVSLRVTVELLDFGAGGDEMPDLTGYPLPGPERVMSQEDLEGAHFEAGRLEGIATWGHFQRAGDYVDLEHVILAMETLAAGGELSVSDEKALDLFSKVQCYLHFATRD